jgi:60 kDa SS-A/Ro ribonucleoprotein
MALAPALRPLVGFGQLRGEGARAADAARLIADFGLPIEAVPNEMKNAEVYEAVLKGVLAGKSGNTLTWLVRNLGNLSKHGLLCDARPDIVKAVCDILSDEDAIKQARVHPVLILKALLTYKQGRGERGHGQWEVVPRVVDALDRAFYQSFRYLTPSGKRIMLGIDVSGSMWGARVQDFGNLSAHEAAAVMALVVMHAEPNWTAVKFDTQARPINISPRMRLDDVVKHVATSQGGGTDLASTIAYARKKKIPTDCFVLFTDNETWAGGRHAHEELALYRAEMGIDAKVVCVSTTANSSTVAPPGDPLFLQVVGFDANVPKLIQEFLAL